MFFVCLFLLWFPQEEAAQAEAAQKAGDFREAARHYHKAAERDPSEINLLNLGRHLIAFNGAADAVKVLDWAVERHPRSAPLKVALAAAHYSLSNYEKAAAIVCEAVDADPADIRTLPFLGDFRDISPRHAAAISQRLGQYVERYPENALARFHHAMMLDDAQREPELRKALQLDPTLAGPALELGALLQSRRQFGEAEAMLRQAIRLQPDSERAHYRLARLYQQTDRPAEAKEQLRIVEKLKAPAYKPSK